MAHDPELLAETRAWFIKAATDLRAAQAMREDVYQAVLHRLPREAHP